MSRKFNATEMARRRRRRGLTQSELARRLKRNRVTVSNIERGALTPGATLARAIGKLLGIPERRLFVASAGEDVPVADLPDDARTVLAAMEQMTPTQRARLVVAADDLLKQGRS